MRDFYGRPLHDPSILGRFKTTLDLYEMAGQLKRQNLARRFPDLDEESVRERMNGWVLPRLSPEDERQFERLDPETREVRRLVANPLFETLQELANDLDSLRCDWALVGGLAVSALAEPRMTKDVDVAVSVASDQEAENLVRDLQARGYRLLEEGIFQSKENDYLSTVRLVPVRGGEQGPVTDLLFAASGIERELVQAARSIEILPGFVVPVARIGHLVAMKVLAETQRSTGQDYRDSLRLLREADDDEVELARRAVDRIAARDAVKEPERLREMLERLLSER